MTVTLVRLGDQRFFIASRDVLVGVYAGLVLLATRVRAFRGGARR